MILLSPLTPSHPHTHTFTLPHRPGLQDASHTASEACATSLNRSPGHYEGVCVCVCVCVCARACVRARPEVWHVLSLPPYLCRLWCHLVCLIWTKWWQRWPIRWTHCQCRQKTIPCSDQGKSRVSSALDESKSHTQENKWFYSFCVSYHVLEFSQLFQFSIPTLPLLLLLSHLYGTVYIDRIHHLIISECTVCSNYTIFCSTKRFLQLRYLATKWAANKMATVTQTVQRPPARPSRTYDYLYGTWVVWAALCMPWKGTWKVNCPSLDRRCLVGEPRTQRLSIDHKTISTSICTTRLYASSYVLADVVLQATPFAERGSGHAACSYIYRVVAEERNRT